MLGSAVMNSFILLVLIHTHGGLSRESYQMATAESCESSQRIYLEFLLSDDSLLEKEDEVEAGCFPSART
jgi:hypothetical protein